MTGIRRQESGGTTLRFNKSLTSGKAGGLIWRTAQSGLFMSHLKVACVTVSVKIYNFTTTVLVTDSFPLHTSSCDFDRRIQYLKIVEKF